MNLADYAMKYIGVQEIPGPKSNPIIKKWIQDYHDNTEDSRISWCSIFLMALTDEFGFYNHGATVAAKSWKNCGIALERTQDALAGDLVIFDRGKVGDWMGHVGIFHSWNVEGKMLVISGNDSDGVRLRPYSIYRLEKVVRLYQDATL